MVFFFVVIVATKKIVIYRREQPPLSLSLSLSSYILLSFDGIANVVEKDGRFAIFPMLPRMTNEDSVPKKHRMIAIPFLFGSGCHIHDHLEISSSSSSFLTTTESSTSSNQNKIIFDETMTSYEFPIYWNFFLFHESISIIIASSLVPNETTYVIPIGNSCIRMDMIEWWGLWIDYWCASWSIRIYWGLWMNRRCYIPYRTCWWWRLITVNDKISK